MAFLQPTDRPRLNEPVGFLLLILAVVIAFSLISHHPFDRSWSVAGGSAEYRNLIGEPGAYCSDLALQWLGLAAFLLPVFLAGLAWCWVRSTPVKTPWARLSGGTLLIVVSCAGMELYPIGSLWQGTVLPGGAGGAILTGIMVGFLNPAGTTLFLFAGAIVALYLLTSFSVQAMIELRERTGNPLVAVKQKWAAWRQGQRERAARRKVLKARRKSGKQAILEQESEPVADEYIEVYEPNDPRAAEPRQEAAHEEAESDGLPPIVPYESAIEAVQAGDPFDEIEEFAPDALSRLAGQEHSLAKPERIYRLPSTLLLKSPAARHDYDPDELHGVAKQICARFQEFGVGGSVAQINPGPVVTTFEFKPDPGIKYSKITNLSEDLCLALECESILVERIPGKSTIGIEVPNRKREIIALREMIECPEFNDASSLLTLALGKDINGRMRVSELTSMPHVLIAGHTGSGKSVLINSLIMSILYKATPYQVRFIMVDPKTVELGPYAEIPHLLTPVITDMKKASNALKNATREMERRLKLLAEHGVRNIDQFNNKAAELRDLPREPYDPEPPANLPYIVLIIDELADLMMIEGRQVEESITRLAQMSRAVGIHLILATQRPSVDVITGLIKANVPARISFRLATRVDSRTILDAMGAEALLGRGDMLFLPPGSGRMVRLHGPLVTEEEIHGVVSFWKEQGSPDYENAFLAPPDDDGSGQGGDTEDAFDDPAYEDAVRIVLEMGKASTSTLQRRLRLGYGRAARILDAMEKDGIIGPPDGSRPREVLKAPDWLMEVERR